MSEIEEMLSERQPKQKRGRGRPKGSTKETKEEKAQEQEIPLTEEEQQELTRKKDILVSVATLGELEQYTGEKMAPAKIRLLPKDRTEALFDVYQSKLGQEMTVDSMEAIVGTTVKVASFLVSFDDNEALKKDLMANKQLRIMLGVKAAGVAEKYGDFVAWARVSFDFVKHLKFPGKDPSLDANQLEVGAVNQGFDPEVGLEKKYEEVESIEKIDL